MALAEFHALCIDTDDLAVGTSFWAGALGLRADHPFGPDDPVLRGDTPEHDVWVNLVPEPHTVKNRVHLDLRAPTLTAFGGLQRLTEPGRFRWTTLRAPGGDEFCVFVDERVRTPRLKDIEVDAVDHAAISQWWGRVLGGTVANDEHEGYSTLSGVGGTAFEDIDFVPVPEPKTVKNRVHWDVRLRPGASIDDLVAAGAVVLRRPDDDIFWTVLADPEGNEFCVVA